MSWQSLFVGGSIHLTLLIAHTNGMLLQHKPLQACASRRLCLVSVGSRWTGPAAGRAAVTGSATSASDTIDRAQREALLDAPRLTDDDRDVESCSPTREIGHGWSNDRPAAVPISIHRANTFGSCVKILR